jgi:hypothetical protein
MACRIPLLSITPNAIPTSTMNKMMGMTLDIPSGVNRTSTGAVNQRQIGKSGWGMNVNEAGSITSRSSRILRAYCPAGITRVRTPETIIRIKIIMTACRNAFLLIWAPDLDSDIIDLLREGFTDR